MCLSKAYIDRDGKRELLMEEVASVEIGDEKLFLKTLFGEKKEIGASIREIDFVANRIVLRNSKN
ncbi:CooT family nickel-binding protein [Chloroflexota bacterium]